MKLFDENWEDIKSKGRLQYAFTRALTFSFVVTIFRNYNVIIQAFQGAEINYRLLLENFGLLFLGAGLGYYTIVWWWKEYLYNRKKSDT